MNLRGAGVAAVAATLVVLAAPGPAAVADPLADARARAAALRAAVTALQTAAEVAAERYDATESQLAVAVTQHAEAEQALQAAQDQQSQSAGAVGDRVRALYMSGGQLGLLATVLDGATLSDVATRYRDAAAIVSVATGSADTAGAVVARRAVLAARLRRIAARETRLQVGAAAAAQQVRDTLARQQALLAGADADVRRIAAEQQAAALAASARAFAARLAAAQAAEAANGGPVDPALAGSTSPPNPVAAAAIAAARTRVGDPYVWGATGPGSFDCSGLTRWAYAQAGVALPRVAAAQWTAGPHPGLADLAPGDLLFWATDPTNLATIHHVALYIGDGYMIAAPHTGTVVQVQPVYLDGYVGAVRPTAPGGVGAAATASGAGPGRGPVAGGVPGGGAQPVPPAQPPGQLPGQVPGQVPAPAPTWTGAPVWSRGS